MNEPAEKQKKYSNRIWVPIVLLVGILLGILSSYVAPQAEEPRFEHLPGPFLTFTPEPLLQFHVIVTTIQIVLLVALLLVYVKVFVDTKANFSLGLVVVLAALLLNTLFSYPLLLGLSGPVSVRAGGFLLFADIFMILAYTVFLYLSLE
jgi:hypothetical protein